MAWGIFNKIKDGVVNAVNTITNKINTPLPDIPRTKPIKPVESNKQNLVSDGNRKLFQRGDGPFKEKDPGLAHIIAEAETKKQREEIEGYARDNVLRNKLVKHGMGYRDPNIW